MSEPRDKTPAANRDLTETVAHKAARKLKARGERQRGVWFGLGMFGLVGWAVAIPAVIGVAIGLWLDARLHDRVSWTLTLLVLGVALGCFNAWYWVRRESRHD